MKVNGNGGQLMPGVLSALKSHEFSPLNSATRASASDQVQAASLKDQTDVLRGTPSRLWKPGQGDAAQDLTEHHVSDSALRGLAKLGLSQ